MEHHIASSTESPGFSGIIARGCRPVGVVERADEAARTCRYHMGDAPKVRVVGDWDMAFTYVPYHLHFTDFGDGEVPDATVVIAEGENDVTVKVVDEGGGMHHR